MWDILYELAKSTPVVAVLVIGIKYFIKKEKEKDNVIKEKEEHIKDLNEEWRENNRESLEIISKLSRTIDKYSYMSDKNKVEIMKEIEQLRVLLKK